MIKNILISFALILPVFLFISLPWFISLAKPEWQESYFPAIWAIVTCAILFISFVAILIYSAVTNKDITKTKLFTWLFGK